MSFLGGFGLKMREEEAIGVGESRVSYFYMRSVRYGYRGSLCVVKQLALFHGEIIRREICLCGSVVVF